MTFLCGCLLLPACTQFEKLAFRPVETPTSTTAKKVEVQIDGQAKILDRGEVNTLSTNDYLANIEQLLSSGREAQARRYIARYPDLAAQVLRASTARQVKHTALQVIALVYDEKCGVHCDHGWQALLQEKAKFPERYAAYEKAREQLQAHVNNRDYAAATALNLRQTLPASAAPLVEMDACQLAAQAWMHCGENLRAAEALERALSVGRMPQPHQAVYAMLALSDVQRRLENHERANDTWQEAVELAARLLSPCVDPPLMLKGSRISEPIADPVLWERCSFYRPYPKLWPAAVDQHVQEWLSRENWLPADQTRAAQDRSDRGEYLVWACIGCCHLQRDEPQAALLALKRAEAATKNSRQRDQMQLIEAEAFAQLEQPVAAMALLVQLAGRPTPEIAAPALALIGTIKLKDGSGQQALGILRQALEKHPNTNWPRRAEAEANLGLAYLTTGREEEGIRWLHSAQRRFADTHATSQLQQCLANEASYWEHAGKRDQADAVREKMEQ